MRESRGDGFVPQREAIAGKEGAAKEALPASTVDDVDVTSVEVAVFVSPAAPPRVAAEVAVTGELFTPPPLVPTSDPELLAPVDMPPAPPLASVVEASIDQKPITSVADVLEALEGARDAESLEAGFLRDGEPFQLVLKARPRP